MLLVSQPQAYVAPLFEGFPPFLELVHKAYVTLLPVIASNRRSLFRPAFLIPISYCLPILDASFIDEGHFHLRVFSVITCWTYKIESPQWNKYFFSQCLSSPGACY